MSEIDVVFHSVANADARRYVEQKVKAMLGVARTRTKSTKRNMVSVKAVADHVTHILDEHTADRQPVMPLHRTADISRYSRSEQKVLKRQRAWFLEQVDQRFPLLDGEHVEPDGDFVSYLTKAFSKYPKGTVVLRRTTNRSVVYYVMREAQVKPRQHLVVLVPHPPLGRTRELKLASEPHWNEAAQKMAAGLAGLLPAPYNVIGASLIALVWPTGSKATTDWAEVYKNMQVILKKNLAEQAVNAAATEVKGFVLFLVDEYAALKADGKKTREHLLDALSEYDKPFFLEIVNVFMYNEKPDLDVASASLANFMLGANLHIGLNQERALIDPDHTKDPEESGYARTAANLASTYAEYARAAAPHVKTLRTDQISTIKENETATASADGSSTLWSWTYWFEDSNNGYRSKQYHYSDVATMCHFVDTDKAKKTEYDAKTALDEYKNAVEAEMDSILKKMVYKVVESWDKIAENPIPDSSQ